MTQPLLSVVICTHNPRANFLRRILEALRDQSLPIDQWELVVVDNASTPPVDPSVTANGHPRARLLVEPELGLTAARLRGISEARTDLLVFVDDDNILATDYLERVVNRSTSWPMLGVWGCGTFTPEWEQDPPRDFGPYIAYLAVNSATRDRWSNQAFDYQATPAGAGLCVRSTVAKSYAANVMRDPRRRRLGRVGTDLTGCEDFDLAFTAIDLGYGIGIFTDLAITHLMPRARVAEDYLLRLVEGHAFSTVILYALRNPGEGPPSGGLAVCIREFRLRHALDPIALKIHDARRRGERKARVLLGTETR